MSNFEKETVLIRPHVNQSLSGHPYEPQTQGPRQVIDIETNINLRVSFMA